MATPSPLCSICADILNVQDSDQLGRRESLVRHHLDFKSFHDAVQARCYICTIVWNCHFKEKKAAGSHSLRGMGWLWNEAAFEEGVVNFSIQVYPKGNADYKPRRVLFRLVDCEGFRFRGYTFPTSLSSTTSSLSSLGLAYSWYLSCRAMHKPCRRLVRNPKWYPTRLLDIGVPGDLTWKLHICADDKIISPNYMTLSYRWGSLPCLKLMQSNIDELRQGQFVDELPQTFRDAVRVLRRFSVRYLWIDSLCIMQDSLEDWERESSTMHDVYANSSCNISAIASADPTGGLFQNHDKDAIQPGLVTLNAGAAQKRYHILDDSYWDRQISNTVLNQRGWVFQERLLAPRVLHFAQHQIFWECFSEQKCEAFSLGVPWQKSLKSFEAIFKPAPLEQSVMSDSAFHQWQNLVESYTKCALTVPGDKLVALSGLAHVFQDATGDEYLGGLWKSRLAHSLHWQAERPMRASSTTYIAPSWSWACGSGSVKWQELEPGYHPLMSVLDARSQPASSDCTGRVVGGFLVVKGLLLRALCEEPVARGRPCVLRLDSEPPNRKDADYLEPGAQRSALSTSSSSVGPQFVIATLYEDFEGTELGNGRTMYCFVLHAQSVSAGGFISDTYLEGLLLEAVSHSPAQFARIGNVQIRSRENAEKCGVCIDIKDGSARINEEARLSEITII